MGYRSDVALALSKKATQQFDEMRKALTPDKQEDLSILLKADTIKHKNDARLYYWKQIKWYEDYQGISILAHFLCSLEESDYLFIRLGEEIADNEVLGDFYSNPFELSFKRQIIYEE